MSNNLRNAITNFIVCDHNKCEHPDALYAEGLISTFENKFPQDNRKFIQCMEDPEIIDKNPCRAILLDGMKKSEPIFNSLCNLERQKTHEVPLIDFNPTVFKSDFWYNSTLGKIWKQAAFNPESSSPELCNDLQKEAENCILDPEMPVNYCQTLTTFARVCPIGVTCPSSQSILLQCLRTYGSFPLYSLNQCLMKHIPDFNKCNEKKDD